MAKTILLSVSEKDFAEFSNQLGEAGVKIDSPRVSKGFDGKSIATIVVAVVPSLTAALIAWLRRRKFMSLELDGKRYVGYTSSEIERIEAALKASED